MKLTYKQKEEILECSLNQSEGGMRYIELLNDEAANSGFFSIYLIKPSANQIDRAIECALEAEFETIRIYIEENSK